MMIFLRNIPTGYEKGQHFYSAFLKRIKKAVFFYFFAEHFSQNKHLKYVKINKNESAVNKKMVKVLTFLKIGLLYNYNWL